MDQHWQRQKQDHFENASGFSKEKKRKKQSVENRFPRWGVSNEVGVIIALVE